MISGWQSSTVIGILPGSVQVAYASPKIHVLKNRNDTANMTKAEEWCRITGLGIDDLLKMDYAFIVRSREPGIYEVHFIKCRNPDGVSEWCRMQWGDASPGGTWSFLECEWLRPAILIRGEGELMLFRLTWG